MIWLFLSILSIAAACLTGWRWFLDARPPITRAEYLEMINRLDAIDSMAKKAQNAVSAMSMNRTRA